MEQGDSSTKSVCCFFPPFLTYSFLGEVHVAGWKDRRAKASRSLQFTWTTDNSPHASTMLAEATCRHKGVDYEAFSFFLNFDESCPPILANSPFHSFLAGRAPLQLRTPRADFALP